MPNMPHRAELLYIIETAMRDTAPWMHKRLERSGELPQVLEDRAAAAEAIFATLHATSIEASSKPHLSHLESVNLAFQGRDAAVREAIEQACDFVDGPNEAPPIHFVTWEDEGRPAISGFISGRGPWGAIWRDGAWRPAPGVARKDRRELTKIQFLRQFPDANLEAAFAFACNVPETAIDW